MILIILLQKGKSSAGMGGFGGGAQVLFGGSGGQDIFQKITWIMGALFMGGSLMLAIMKSRQADQPLYLKDVQLPRQTSPAPVFPSKNDMAPLTDDME